MMNTSTCANFFIHQKTQFDYRKLYEIGEFPACLITLTCSQIDEENSE